MKDLLRISLGILALVLLYFTTGLVFVGVAIMSLALIVYYAIRRKQNEKE